MVDAGSKPAAAETKAEALAAPQEVDLLTQVGDCKLLLLLR